MGGTSEKEQPVVATLSSDPQRVAELSAKEWTLVTDTIRRRMRCRIGINQRDVV
jgi:hypothetical protein